MRLWTLECAFTQGKRSDFPVAPVLQSQAYLEWSFQTAKKVRPHVVVMSFEIHDKNVSHIGVSHGAGLNTPIFDL